jgi:hypothetical protein
MHARNLIAAALLGLAATAVTGNALASSVEFKNATGQKICFGNTTNSLVEGEGASADYFGWTCVESGSSFTADLVDGYTIISAIDSTGNDFLVSRLGTYVLVPTFAPVGVVDSFGAEIESHIDGTFTYAYSIGESDWTEDFVVANYEEAKAGLIAAGFRQITGRVFKTEDVGDGLTVELRD